MKSLFVGVALFVVSVTALSASANSTCNDLKVEVEVEAYLNYRPTPSRRQAPVGVCLRGAIREYYERNQVQIRNSSVVLTEQRVILAIKNELDLNREAAKMKGEIFEKGLMPDGSSLFSDQELQMLDADADAKRRCPLYDKNGEINTCN